MTLRPIAPVTFGMAGVIHTDPRGAGNRRPAHDEGWLTFGFRMVPYTTKSEWRSESGDVVIVTYQHALEANTDPGVYQFRMPSDGDLDGVVMGHFFDRVGPSSHVCTLSQHALRAYGRSGATSFRNINGSWVAVLWDRATREARFVRDGTGIQPIYAARLEGRIVFATDLRVFQASGMLDALDEQALAEFLHYLYIPPPRSLVTDCHAVLPGYVLTIGETIRQDRFTPPRFVMGPRLDPSVDPRPEIERHLPEFEERLLAAVADCIPTTGRVALTLSGGKDSSTLAVALSKICPDRVMVLNVAEKHATLDESRDAAIVCRALGLEFQAFTPTDEELARGIGAFARQLGQPMGDPAAIPYFLGMAQLPDDCAVLLDGTGNDDYFGSTSSEKGIEFYRRRIRTEKYFPGILWPALLRAMPLGGRKWRRLSHYWSRPVEEAFVAWDGWSADELSRLFQRRVSFEQTHLWRLMREANPDEWMSLLTEVLGGIWEPETSFAKAVHLGRALGRGVRFPFIDKRLEAFVHQLPWELKDDKAILRAYMAKNLPPEIVRKPKSGFAFDLNRLFRNPLYRWADELDRAGLLRSLATWSDEPIQALRQAYAAEPHDYKKQHRLYAICLAATVLASKDGYDTDIKRH